MTLLPAQPVPPSWFVYGGEGSAEERLEKLLTAIPPWRDFARRAEVLASTYQVNANERELVNAALYLRRPLLITGPPGSGKSSLAYAVSRDLDLGAVLRWPINSRSSLNEGLYSYDAIARLRDVEISRESQQRVAEDIGRYIRLNPLGTALYPSAKPRVLLIDEIDKSDIDLPNDLLHVFEEGEFEIPELARIADLEGGREIEVETADPVEPGQSRRRVKIQRGLVRCTTFPFVVLTSNRERDLPPAFFRRCLRLDLPERATPDHLAAIVRAHLGEVDRRLLEEVIHAFTERQEARNLVASDQLLNAIYLISRGTIPQGQEREKLIHLLLRELNR
jgi:MoxR-like ATPase